MEHDDSLSTSSLRKFLSKTPKQLELLDRFEMELRLGRLSTSSTFSARNPVSADYPTKNYGGISGQDRRRVTSVTVELLQSVVGLSKWKTAAELMVLLRGLGRELHAAGGFREPAIGNIVRRVMGAVRDEVAAADAMEQARETQKLKANTNSNEEEKEDVSYPGAEGSDMERIDEDLAQTFATNVTMSSTNTNPAPQGGMPRNLSLSTMLWAHPQHYNTKSSKSTSSNNYNAANNSSSKLRSDSISSVNSTENTDRLSQTSSTHQSLPQTFYMDRPHYFRTSISEAISEIKNELEDLHKNIDDQASSHIHTGEVILTYARSKTIESFLKTAAKKRRFSVIVCEGAPHFGGHAMAKSLASTGIDTTVINDSAAFAVMARVNKVLLPAHAVLANGGLIAPSGSHMVALAAKHNSVPLVSITGMFKLCPMYPHDGPDTLQDLISPASVVDYMELSEEKMSEKVELINPVYDYIPPDLVSLYVTNIGAFQSSYIYRLLAEYYHSDDWESFE
jgi:translation initiation factor eIF-2B subunit beta